MAKLTGDVREEFNRFVLGGGAEESRREEDKDEEGGEKVHANEASKTEETGRGEEEEEERRGGGGGNDHAPENVSVVQILRGSGGVRRPGVSSGVGAVGAVELRG